MTCFKHVEVKILILAELWPRAREGALRHQQDCATSWTASVVPRIIVSADQGPNKELQPADSPPVYEGLFPDSVRVVCPAARGSTFEEVLRSLPQTVAQLWRRRAR